MTAIHCPRCHAAIAAPPELAGQNVLCPKCRQLIHLPSPELDITPPLIPSPRPALAPLSAEHAPALQPATLQPARQSPPGKAAAARYIARRNAIGGAVLISWGVLMALLCVAGVLIWRLKVSRDERLAQATQAEPMAASLPIERPEPIEETSADAPPNAPAEPVSSPEEPEETPPVSPFEIVPSGFDNASPNVPMAVPPVNPFAIPPGIAPRPGPVTPSSAPRATPNPVVPMPAAPPSSAAVQVVSASPLASLPNSVRLPSLVSSAKEKLLDLPPGLSELPSIALRSLAADIPSSSAIFTEADETRTAWRAYYVFDLNTAANKTEIGTFHVSEAELAFAWASPQPVAALCQQLGNCLLELRSGDEVQLVQLRERKVLPPLVLDMNEDRQILEFPLSDLPKADSIRLELRELVGFSQGASLRNQQQSLAIGKQAVLEFSEMPGAEIGIRLSRASKTSPLQIRLEPVFRENSVSEYELTLKRLDALADAVKRTLDRDRKQFPLAKEALEDLQDNLSRLQSRRPGNIQLLGPWQQQVTRLSKDVDRAADKVKQLARRIPENEARLKAVPKMKRFLESLHQQCELRYALVAECGEHDLVLADGTQPLGAE